MTLAVDWDVNIDYYTLYLIPVLISALVDRIRAGIRNTV